jgi:hypothetical protein
VTRRRGLGVVLGGLAIVAAVALLARVVFDRAVYEAPEAAAPAPASPPAGAAPAPAAPADPSDVAVVAVSGSVERSGRDGRWTRVAAGDRLATDDALRTGDAARADLRVGERSRITVAERSQVAVREVTAAVHRLRLSRGRVAVEYERDGARTLRIEDATGQRVAESQEGRFSVLASGATLAVATETGSVTLRAAGKAVDVGAGQQSVAAAGAPSPAAPIPVDLLLRVADEARSASDPDDLCAHVRGRAAAGAEVTVDDHPVALERDGRFAVRVPRRAGLTAVRVTTRDPGGRSEARDVPCRDPDERLDGLSVRWKT